ncbi:hypothetical protein AALB53_24095, partial [Lachnospiraceae bacterium 47-T17]
NLKPLSQHKHWGCGYFLPTITLEEPIKIVKFFDCKDNTYIIRYFIDLIDTPFRNTLNGDFEINKERIFDKFNEEDKCKWMLLVEKVITTTNI